VLASSSSPNTAACLVASSPATTDTRGIATAAGEGSFCSPLCSPPKAGLHCQQQGSLVWD
jgi:hypothetical protein